LKEKKPLWLCPPHPFVHTIEMSLKDTQSESSPLDLISFNLICFIYFSIRDMISKILAVQLSQLQPIVEKWLKPIFFSNHVLSIVSPQDKIISIMEGFDK
jgi:hypothetical protein